MAVWDAPHRDDVVNQGLPFNHIRGTDIALLCFNACSKSSLDAVVAYKSYFDKVKSNEMVLRLVGIVPKGVDEVRVKEDMLKRQADEIGL